jgi:transcriptional regulator with XRE-family HTH domain
MNRVKQLRTAREMRKEALAAAADVSLSYIHLLEGENPPTPGLERARAIAEALGVSVDEAFPAPVAESR